MSSTMAPFSCVVLLALLGLTLGQNSFHIHRDGITLNGNGANILPFDPVVYASSMCYNGDTLFYELGDGVIHSVNTNDLTNLSENIIFETPLPTVNSELKNIACCCNALAFGYFKNNSIDVGVMDEVYVIHVMFLTRNVELRFLITAGTNTDAPLVGDNDEPIVTMDCKSRYMFVITRNNMWTYDLENPATAPIRTSLALDGFPTTASVYVMNGEPLAIFASLVSGGQIAVIDPKSVKATNHIELFDVKSSLVVTALTIDGSKLLCRGYYLAQTTEYTFELDVTTIAAFTSDGQITDVTVLTKGTKEPKGTTPDSYVNGIGRCSNNCRGSCSDTTCTTCDSADCGFCSPSTGKCVCATTSLEECYYSQATIAAGTCKATLLTPDAYCVVQHPNAKRRVGPAVDILGFTYVPGTVGLSRKVKTGRWPISALPSPRVSSDGTDTLTSASWRKFSAAVPPRWKGRRFGIYDATITPTDRETYRLLRIPCIATENSGFFNQLSYTYTASVGGGVVLAAAVNARNAKHVTSFRWHYAPALSPAQQLPVPLCNGQLACTINALTVGNEGTYEVFRPRRYKRSWHPIFYLFVRRCSANFYDAPTCAKPCPFNCVEGQCDDDTGKCICHAGWTGNTCNTQCAAGMVGQTCKIACSDLFADSPGCENLLLCAPGKAGCTCYPGLTHPTCAGACLFGKWGTNCERTCVDPAAGCNARTGAALN